MPSPRVSVVIPTYNRARYLVEAIESVLTQTLADREVIVVDDGSTDDTPAVIAPYLDRVRFLRQENRGLAAARNAGIREARGEFVAFLDSDDRFDPRMLEAVLGTFGEHPEAGAVCVAEREMDEEGRPRQRVHTKRSPGIFFTTASLLSRDTGVGCGRPPVARRSLLETLGGFDETMRSAVDCEMWIRASLGAVLVLQPEPLVLRRVHGGHLSGDRGQNARHWLLILDWLAREHPEFLREHRWVYRRAAGKENLRLGRELLARSAREPGCLPEARRALRRSIGFYPFFIRAYLYLAWGYLFPSSYGPWRRWERR